MGLIRIAVPCCFSSAAACVMQSVCNCAGLVSVRYVDAISAVVSDKW